jgi:hypothetical protein
MARTTSSPSWVARIGIFGLLTLGAVPLLVAGPASADDPTPSSSPAPVVLECRSGVVTAGEVSTSAIVVTRDAASVDQSVWPSCIAS